MRKLDFEVSPTCHVVVVTSWCFRMTVSGWQQILDNTCHIRAVWAQNNVSVLRIMTALEYMAYMTIDWVCVVQWMLKNPKIRDFIMIYFYIIENASTTYEIFDQTCRKRVFISMINQLTQVLSCSMLPFLLCWHHPSVCWTWWKARVVWPLWLHLICTLVLSMFTSTRSVDTWKLKKYLKTCGRVASVKHPMTGWCNWT